MVKNRSYRTMGVLFALVSVPGWVSLALGRLMNQSYPFALLSFLAVPVALLFFVFGAGFREPNGRSWIALRTGIVSLAFVVFLLASLAVVAAGVEPMMTSAIFCATASSYVGLVTLILLVAAALQRRPRPEPS